MSDELYKYLKIERDEEEDRKEIEKIDRLLFLGLMFILLVVPLVIRVHIVEYISPLIMDEQILDTGKKGDIFTYYKSRLLIVSTAILSLLFVYKVVVLKYSIPRTKLNISLALLVALVTLSAIFAPYKTLALYGIYNRNEGTITYLCYFMLFFIAANIRYTQKRLKWALYCLYPFVLINTLLGIVNFYGYNVLEVEWIKKLLYSNLPEGAKLTEGSRLIATINHGNYVSGISAVLTTLFLTWALLDKNKVRSIVNFVMSLLCFAMLLGSFSVSGFLTLMLIFPFLFLLIFKSLYKRKFAVTFATFLVGAACIYVVMVNHNPKVWDETFGFFIKSNPFAEARAVVNEFQKAFQAGYVYAETGSNQENKEYQLPPLPESGVGPGSGRLYIWKKTWELIKQRPLLGYGLDTLPYFFPQDDPEKHANIETYTVIVDKPHNFYIGIAYGAGVIALIVFVVFIVNIGLLTIKRLISTKLVDDKQAIFASISIACGAYLIQALFNDSIIGVSVIFWILISLLVSSLMENKQEKIG